MGINLKSRLYEVVVTTVLYGDKTWEYGGSREENKRNGDEMSKE